MWDGKIRDMPKLESPFVRKIIDGNYIVTPEIAEGYEWVFSDDAVIATEKLDGTNVSIIVENGAITSIWNRTARIPFFNHGKKFIIDGVLESYERGFCELPDGQFFGELIGEKLAGNPYKIKGHLWLPFSTYFEKHLRYKSWGKYPKTYEAISAWFENDLFSLFMRGKHDETVPPEGIVFVHPDGRMAKLRRDMFPFWKGSRHKSNAEVKEVEKGGD